MGISISSEDAVEAREASDAQGVNGLAQPEGRVTWG